jgi:1-acyl-sn-glycerol-3-phosphate acyltransferase
MLDQPPPAPRRRPSAIVRLFRPLARGWQWATGFRVEGELPDLKKYVIIAAPHTTNWDLPHTLAAGILYGARVHWMGKDTIFRWPFGGLMRWLGGLSVDRSKSNNAVAGMVQIFAERDELALIIAPAGTRTSSMAWKSGFYHVAVGAGVPLVLAFIDYAGKRVGIAQVFYPTGNYEADLVAIQDVYRRIAPQGMR